MLLKTLPPDARPREKLLARGAAALSDAELLALLLRTGMQGKNVIVLAQEIVQRFGGIAGLLHADATSLKDIKGLGPSKRAELQAVLELSRRALAEQLQQTPVLETPQAMRDFVRLQIGSKPYEVFTVLFLDVQQRLIASEELFRGTLAQTSVYPREVALRALQLQASHLVLAHNHPSGSVEPSAADMAITAKLKTALALLDIRVIDHVIVGPGQSLSMLEMGLI
jgi:DNA repair protein RadC